jgi:hypothetical protein
LPQDDWLRGALVVAGFVFSKKPAVSGATPQIWRHIRTYSRRRDVHLWVSEPPSLEACPRIGASCDRRGPASGSGRDGWAVQFSGRQDHAMETAPTRAKHEPEQASDRPLSPAQLR